MFTRRSSGFTLIEMIIAIVIIGVGLAGVLTAFTTSVTSSADPLIHKQMLAVAEEMMEEILLKPFAVTGVAPVNAATACGVAAAIRKDFDDVSDYHNYQTNGVCDIDGTAVAGLATYGLRVTVVANAAVAVDLVGLPIGAVKKITVVVSHGGETISLVGWRTDYGGMKARGFTLVELVMVIVITGILAASLTVFLKPVIDSYFDTRRRADLTDIADTALRRMSQDLRSAVPNSVRLQGASPSTCFQLVPTITGGRYRMTSDTVNDAPPPLPCNPLVSATCSAPLDVSQATTVFDVLSPMATAPGVGDWIVIGNQNGADVYSALNPNKAQITAAPSTPRPTDGLQRITVGATQFPTGYDGGRFVVVRNTAQTVVYSCVGGTLYRTVALFGANLAATCALTTGAVVATDIAATAGSCKFVYDPNQGATQQSGFVWMRLELSRSGESVALAHGVHVDNVP